GILPPLFGYVTSLGFSFPNAIAGAMAHQAGRAGTASALLGTLQFAMATFAGGFVGLLHVESAIPMAAVMAVCGVSALLIHSRLVKPLGRSSIRSDGTEIDCQVVE
ncbi:MAG: hypothetical protein ABI882_22415, partial [Acidobacteriota bacterium]